MEEKYIRKRMKSTLYVLRDALPNRTTAQDCYFCDEYGALFCKVVSSGLAYELSRSVSRAKNAPSELSLGSKQAIQ